MYWNYFKLICIHKWYVFIECFKQGIVWQGITHDLSKFTPSEFVASARYYNGCDNEEEYQKACLHHKGRNKHHWEYWVDWDYKTGEYKLIDIPFKYLKEMYADMVGASKAYNKSKFDPRYPLEYFINSKTFIMNEYDREFLIKKLTKLAETYEKKYS